MLCLFVWLTCLQVIPTTATGVTGLMDMSNRLYRSVWLLCWAKRSNSSKKNSTLCCFLVPSRLKREREEEWEGEREEMVGREREREEMGRREDGGRDRGRERMNGESVGLRTRKESD